MARDFQAVELEPDRPIQNVALVGDIYSKYCSLGNWNLLRFLERHSCQVGVNGLTWYALYYLDSHLETGPLPTRLGGKLLAALGGPMQRRFIGILRAAGFAVLPPYRALKTLARELNATRCALGSGWLLAAETAAWVHTGYRKVLSGLPFRGIFSARGSTPPSSASCLEASSPGWITTPPSGTAQWRTACECWWTRSCEAGNLFRSHAVQTAGGVMR